MHCRLPRPGDQLIEQGERVTHTATPGPNDERQHTRLQRNPLGITQLLNVVEHLRRRDQAEWVVMRSRSDGADHLVGLGGSKDELHVFRRLFDDLEQGIEALRGDHMRLVEDKDFVAIAGGSEHRSLAQITRIVDTVVAGRVDFYNIQ